MNLIEYKRVMNKIEPDVGLENRLAQGLLQKKPRRKTLKLGVWIAASLIILISAGLVVPEMWKDEFQPLSITIPKIELPKGSNALYDMIGLIVYKGQIYTQTSTHITPEAAKQLLGNLIGRTKASIDEWSKQKDYVELASTIGVTDVYTVKGYDSDFRIMSYQTEEGQIFTEFYERLNGITITKGEDLIGKTNLKGNVNSVKWQSYDNWNNSKPQFEELQAEESITAFLTALYEAKPIAAEPLQKAGIYNNGEQIQKVLYLKLKDQTEVQLRLFKGNYVLYGGPSVFFEVDPVAFSALWDKME
jgi:hypothetical protein